MLWGAEICLQTRTPQKFKILGTYLFQLLQDLQFPDEWQMVKFSRYVGNAVSSVCTIQNYNGGVRKLHDLIGYVPSNPDDANCRLIIQSLRAE